MKIAATNNNPVERPLYTCSVCGLDRSWSKEHGCVERMAGEGLAGYDVIFIICSNECRKKCRDKFIELLSKHSGWTVKTAAENFDLYVLPSLNITD